MFQYFMISIVVVPVLLGVQAARRRERKRSWRLLRIGWVLYAGLWIGMLFYLRYRWR